jgi:hypothetical protein
MNSNRGFVDISDTGTGDAGNVVFPSKHTLNSSKSAILPEIIMG